MPVQFISSAHLGPSTGLGYTALDPEYTRRYVRMLDDGGFDYTLCGYDSKRVDSVTRAQLVLNYTERIAPVVAHRPGFQFPTQFAKAIAALDRIGNGRVMIHIIAGGNDVEQRREGDYTTKEERYRRAEEFIGILRRVWYEEGPISHASWQRRSSTMSTAAPRSSRFAATTLNDVIDYGRQLLPLVRQELAHRRATGQRGSLQANHPGNYAPEYAAFATAA